MALIGKMELHVRVLRRRPRVDHPKIPGHSEVKGEPARVVPVPRKEVLAVAAGRLQLGAEQVPPDGAGRDPVEDPLVELRHRVDGVMQRRGTQVSLERLDVGQLRHMVLGCKARSATAGSRKMLERRPRIPGRDSPGLHPAEATGQRTGQKRDRRQDVQPEDPQEQRGRPGEHSRGAARSTPRPASRRSPRRSRWPRATAVPARRARGWRRRCPGRRCRSGSAGDGDGAPTPAPRWRRSARRCRWSARRRGGPPRRRRRNRARR